MNNEPIHFHRYTLRSRAPLNAKSARTEFEGALIRAGGGFGCVHPWPELGDEPLDQQLLALAEGKTTALTARSLRCCQFDSMARQRGQSLFEGLEIPPSHYSMPADDSSIPPDFSTVKIKGGGVDETVARIQNLPGNLSVRVDFNESLSIAEFIEFWESLGPDQDRIEFIEDPAKFDDSIWAVLDEALRCRLAVDRAVETVGAGPGFRVVKPAIDDPARQESLAGLFNQQLVFTSYMDHPIGQVYAAFEAANSFKRNPESLADCGLVTQHLFDDSDPFVATLGPPKPVLDIPSGSGLGFDGLLESLTWNRLTTSSC